MHYNKAMNVLWTVSVGKKGTNFVAKEKRGILNTMANTSVKFQTFLYL